MKVIEDIVYIEDVHVEDVINQIKELSANGYEMVLGIIPFETTSRDFDTYSCKQLDTYRHTKNHSATMVKYKEST